MNRLGTAFRLFWNALTNPEFAARGAALFEAPAEGPDVRVLQILQRDGRLVDFLSENLDPYSDQQIGAEARVIQRDCRQALNRYLELEPVRPEAEGSPVRIDSGFDPTAIRLVGNVSGSGPYRGTLKHHGWRIKAVKFPAGMEPRPGAEGVVLAPAEVEIS